METNGVIHELVQETEGKLERLANGRTSTPMIKHPLDDRKDYEISELEDSRKGLSMSLESLEMAKEEMSSYEERWKREGLPRELDSGTIGLSDEEDEDHSIFEAVLSPDCQDVRLTRGDQGRPLPRSNQKRKIQIRLDLLNDEDMSNLSDNEVDQMLSPSLDSPDEIENSILEQLGEESSIPELSAEEEREEARSWKICQVGGVERRIDMKVIEPYQRVLSHGGYLNTGSHNAIIVFSACYLPHHSRVDYSYVMDNLFCYILLTLDQLVTDDYVLVYLHGGTSRECVPPFSWLKRCYRMIDHKLRKNLKRLYLVHPTFWLKTIVLMTKPFVSTKFSRKIQFINSLAELYDTLPLEQACVPDRVHQYDRIKQSIQQKK